MITNQVSVPHSPYSVFYNKRGEKIYTKMIWIKTHAFDSALTPNDLGYGRNA